MAEGDASWCPSLPNRETELKSSTYHHAPGIIGPVALGVDEAGRGPVLGPMVYGVAYCAVDWKPDLAALGFDDSKVLTAEVRDALMRRLIEDPDCSSNIGWATTIMTAQDITAGMLRPGIPYNLNQQAHDATIALIQLVLDSGIEVCELFVDTVGPPDSYAAKLRQRFPEIRQVVVTKKADSLYPVVSCASVCAKVTRDLSLASQLSKCGSGYPSDPNTVAWLRREMDPVFGWGPLVRYSWGTAKVMLDEKYEVEWIEAPPVTGEGLASYGIENFAVPY